MLIDCTVCDEGTASDGGTCNICGGDGELNLTDDNFPQHIQRWKLHGVVWDAILTNQADMEDKIDLQDIEIAAIKVKTDNLPNDTAAWITILRNKIDAIKAVVDAL